MKKIIKNLLLISLLAASQLSIAEDQPLERKDLKMALGVWNVEYLTPEGVKKETSFSIDHLKLGEVGSNVASGKIHDTGDLIGCRIPGSSVDVVVPLDLLCFTKDIATNYRIFGIKYDTSGLITEAYYGEGPDLITATGNLLEQDTLVTGANITLYGGVPAETDKPPVETGACGITYSPEFGTFTVPEIIYSGKKFKVTFKNVGNFLFKVENAELSD